MPEATDGAAPMMTTKRMADSLRPNRTRAIGYQSTEGIVCRPVISEATPVRSTLTCERTAPMAVPMTTAEA